MEVIEIRQKKIISIHAPTRGATLQKQKSQPKNINFNPRSYKRSDVFCNAQVFCAMLFQSTLLQEERRRLPCVGALNNEFQSTLLQEERQQKCTIFLMHLCNNYCIVSI